MAATKVIHYSDILCIWAHVGQQNLYRLTEEFGDRIEIETHFCSVFPDAQTKIETAWKDRGGFEGYATHVGEVVAQFDGIGLHDDVWRAVRPRSSASPHLFLKAVELLEEETGQPTAPFAERATSLAARELRRAFFTEALDVANWDVQRDVCSDIGLSFDRVLRKIETGQAIAILAADYEAAQIQGVQGSPTYILNEGRQKLFGNISYGILEANIKELVSGEFDLNASVCS